MEPRRDLLATPERLAAVRRTGLLDTPSEECFDQLTRLAAETLGVTAAFLSIVDEMSDFYKSSYGFPEPLATTRRLEGETFCHHAIVRDGLLVIDDARLEDIYSAVEALRTMGVIAYLGVPLHSSDGQALGAFCLVDIKPRHWTKYEIRTACLLARSALREIESRDRGAAPFPDDVAFELSPRERDVMHRLISGQRLKEIAFDLGRSVKTIATHRQRLLKKLGCADNRDLYRLALRAGLLDWESKA